MIGQLKNHQELQVSVHPVMRRKLPPSARGCSPPGHLFCTTVGEFTGLVSVRDTDGRALRFKYERTSLSDQRGDRDT
jgi:hypothetical protein